jgi:hypothetical protein
VTLTDATVDEVCACSAAIAADVKRHLGGRELSSVSDKDLLAALRAAYVAHPLGPRQRAALALAARYFNLKENIRPPYSGPFDHDPDDDASGYLFEDTLAALAQRLGPATISVLERRHDDLRRLSCGRHPPSSEHEEMKATVAMYRLYPLLAQLNKELGLVTEPTPPWRVDAKLAASKAVVAPLPQQPPVCSADGWCWEEPWPQGNTLRAVAGRSASDVWAVGDRGTALHFDGNAWSRRETGSSAVLRAIVPLAGAVWAVGDGATVLRWDGRRWTKVPVPTGVNLHGIASLGANGLSVVGARGTFLRYDGVRWTKEARPRLGRLRTVLELAPGNAWAASEGGRVLHFDGRSWTSMVAPGPRSGLPAYGLLAAWAQAPDDVWFAGRDLLHWDGRAFAALDLTGEAIWGAGARDVWVVGQGGYVRRFDGEGWTYAPRPTENALFGVWGSGPDDVWVVGEQGTLLHHNGHAWSGGATEAPLTAGAIWGHGSERWSFSGPVASTYGAPRSRRSLAGRTEEVEGAPWLAAVYGLAADDLWGVGGYGDAHHWNGQTWTHAHSTIPQDAKAIWSSGPDDVWICGGYDGLAHFDGKTWSRQPNPYPETVPGRADWFALWGTGRRDLWLAGDRSNEAALYHFDGAGWTTAKIPRLPPNTTLYAIGGSDRNHVWAVGRTFNEGAVVLRRDATRWFVQRLPDIRSLAAIWVHDGRDVWAVGADGVVVHFDGRRWQKQDTGTSVGFTAVWGDAERIWIAGPNAVLSRPNRRS